MLLVGFVPLPYPMYVSTLFQLPAALFRPFCLWNSASPFSISLLTTFDHTDTRFTPLSCHVYIILTNNDSTYQASMTRVTIPPGLKLPKPAGGQDRGVPFYPRVGIPFLHDEGFLGFAVVGSGRHPAEMKLHSPCTPTTTVEG
jgi:hypothetical protein